MTEMSNSIRNWIMQILFMLIQKKPLPDSVHPWKPVAFVDIPIKTMSGVKASSQANKQINFWVIVITLQVVRHVCQVTDGYRHGISL